MIGRKNDWSEKDIDCAFLPEEGEKGDKDHKRFHDRLQARPDDITIAGETMSE